MKNTLTQEQMIKLIARREELLKDEEIRHKGHSISYPYEEEDDLAEGLHEMLITLIFEILEEFGLAEDFDCTDTISKLIYEYHIYPSCPVDKIIETIQVDLKK